MSNTITDVAGDNRILMSNGRFARPLTASFLSSWSKIRIALHLDMTDSGGSLTGTPQFGVGLCAGNTNILGDATTTHWVGIISNTGTWSRGGGPSYGYGDARGATKVGTTLSLTGSSNLGGGTFTTLADGTRRLYFVEITRGSPDFSTQVILYNVSTGGSDVPDADFLIQSAAGVPTFANHFPGSGPQTIAVDEGTNGTLDHVNIWYDQSTALMRIANLRVYKLA